MKVSWLWSSFICTLIIAITGIAASSNVYGAVPHRILLDTDVDTDDFFAILYLLKLNRSEFSLEVMNLSSNLKCISTTLK
ncbi:inosine/uridine-preferring nucleoside hydrolase domain-containing protein [Artemisia annua]|uniref:Inosine/uridine-preferring nucleoside hydrolase domain-containing protein n=1 Tax=Artemisia annua TaxID=35608 RepID=A0A2U1NVK1_ARTAN|nr:inosine/uridine-preferring nucleoside hydrolase domain-containing protein [Artemisia annua]